MPVGSLHSFKNETDKNARMIISIAPAGLEKMFFEVGQQLGTRWDRTSAIEGGYRKIAVRRSKIRRRD